MVSITVDTLKLGLSIELQLSSFGCLNKQLRFNDHITTRDVDEGDTNTRPITEQVVIVLRGRDQQSQLVKKVVCHTSHFNNST